MKFARVLAIVLLLVCVVRYSAAEGIWMYARMRLNVTAGNPLIQDNTVCYLRWQYFTNNPATQNAPISNAVFRMWNSASNRWETSSTMKFGLGTAKNRIRVQNFNTMLGNINFLKLDSSSDTNAFLEIAWTVNSTSSNANISSEKVVSMIHTTTTGATSGTIDVPTSPFLDTTYDLSFGITDQTQKPYLQVMP